MKLHLDFETYSSEDLRKTGAHKYVESPDFEILMIGYAYEDNPVQVIDLAAGDLIPGHLFGSFKDRETVLSAHNAAFERLCLQAYGIETEIKKWECTMVKAAYYGFPLSLDKLAHALDLDVKKDAAGKRLIKYFTQPCKATKVNSGRTRNFHFHSSDDWQSFKDYCKTDVEVERKASRYLDRFGGPLPEDEQRMYGLDQRINDKGIRIDTRFVKKLISVDRRNTADIRAEMKEITGVDNPNSQPQLVKWLSENMGLQVTSLAKDTLPDLLKEADPLSAKVIDLRKRLSKASVKKYQTMLDCVGFDSKGRGFFQFYGANRTGRWAGRKVQLQNLPRIKDENIDGTRQAFAEDDYDTLIMCYDRISDSLSELVRTALVASPENKLIVSDFSAIEARVIAWYAREQWRLDVFHGHGKIYEASASMMFNVAIEDVTKGSDYRAKGKVAELALGYQGGVNALKTMGGEAMGLSEIEMKSIVDKWRAANPMICKFWTQLNKAAILCVESKKDITIKDYKLRFLYKEGAMAIELPSGRRLFYQGVATIPNKWGGLQVVYRDAKTWLRTNTYGGKLAENIVQATARDLLRDAMLSVYEIYGAVPVLHVHDEIAYDEKEERLDLDRLEKIMSARPDWAPDIPLDAEGYVSNYYKKD